VCVSCEKERPLTFSEINSVYKDYATIEINIPKAEGNSTISNAINITIENLIVYVLNFSGNNSKATYIGDAVKNFQTEYKQFKDDFEESDLVWEATFDGEVTYQSSEVVSIALSSYSFTGGAHGNMDITFLNFNPQTGSLFKFNDIINNKEGFTKLVKKYFKKEISSSTDSDNGFFEDSFQLPENIGFNEEGIILLYNTYEIASYAQGITEFTIPYEEMDTFLKIH
jgi:hypothetical protein